MRRRRVGRVAVLLALLIVVAVVPAATGGAAAAPPAPSSSAGLAAYVPGRVLVGFRPGVSAAGQAAAIRLVGARQLRVVGVGAHVLALASPEVTGAIRMLRANPAVRYAEPDYYLRPLQTPNDPVFPQQWALQNTGQPVNNGSQSIAGTSGDDIDVTRAWDLTTGSKSVVIGLVDDSFDYTNFDLAANAWNNPGGIGGCPAGTHGYDVTTDTCNPCTTCGADHGTGMAWFMGAVGDNDQGSTGVNWTTAIMAASVDGTWSDSNVVAALQWIVQARQAGVNVRVINASWGGDGIRAIADEITAAGQAGILFVTAAGNGSTFGGVDNDTTPDYPCSFGFANEICVAAVDQNFQLASFSNYGVNSVDLAAPGVNMCSPSGCGGQGTSDSTAIVSGAVALLAAAHPDWSMSDLRAAIVGNVRPVAGLAGKVRTGGVLDVYCAMTLCRTPLPSPSPSPSQTPTPTPTPTVTPTPSPSPSPGPPSVSITSGPTSWSRSRTATFTFTASDPAGAPVATSCRLDGATPAGCNSGQSYPNLADGSHMFTVTATTADGRSATAGWTWSIDATRPSVRVTAPTTPFTLGHYRIAWTGTDATSGVAGYQLRYRRAPYNGRFSAWSNPVNWTNLSTTHLSRIDNPGWTDCVTIRVRDHAGNYSPWTPAWCTARPLDDRALTRHGYWARRTGTSYYLHTITTTSSHGAALTRSNAVTDRIAIVATRCPTCGTIRVYTGSHLIATIHLYATRTQHHVLIVLPRFRLRTATITIRVTTTNRSVQIDGLGTTRT